MLIGPHSTAMEREAFRNKNPRRAAQLIAQPTLAFSRAACFTGDRIEPAAHRPASVRPLRRSRQHRAGRSHQGRPAQGSLVVNSSQGGGSKDTWVLQD